MSIPEINWETIRSIDDVIVPHPFSELDRNHEPNNIYPMLFNIEHGSRVRDMRGNRYLLLGWGSVQGTVILRDRYRRQFHADGADRMEVVR